MKRLENWESRLFAFIESRKKTPMQWGTDDCFMLVVGAIKAMTGVDPKKAHPDARLIGSYDTPNEGYRTLRNYSGKGLVETCSMFANKMGMAVKDKAFASRGDVAIVETETVIGGVREVMGVVLGDVVASQGKDGIVYNDISKAKMIWTI